MVEVSLKFKNASAAEYIGSLLTRMNKHKISQNALARALGKDPSQVSRWFTPNPDRRVVPELETVLEIEKAMAGLVARAIRARG